MTRMKTVRQCKGCKGRARDPYEDCKAVGIPMDQNNKPNKDDQPDAVDISILKPYRSLLGSLSHLARFTRPDIKFAVFYLARYQARPGERHLKGLFRILRYLKGTLSAGLTFNTNDDLLTVYCDSDHAGCVDTRRSTSGYVFFMYGGPILTKTIQQKSVALSSTEAEVLALSRCVRDLIWVRNLLSEFNLPIGKTKVYEDNSGAISIANNSALCQAAKHIAIAYTFIREKVRKNLIVIAKIDGTKNIADIFTKPVKTAAHKYLKEFLHSGLKE